jgi:hypothetical protein
MALVEDQMNWSENFGNFVEHIDQLNVNTAVVDALYETRSGAFQALFKGSNLPVQQDVFGRIAWQLRTRADVDVFARLPVSKTNAPGLAALVDQLGVISHLNGLVLDVKDMGSFAEYRDDIYARLQSRRPGSKLLIQIDEALFAQQSRRMLNELAGRVDYVLVTVSNAASKRQLRRLVRSLVKNDRVEKFAVILQESGRRSSAVVPDLSRSTALLAELQEQGLVHVGYEPPAGLLIKQSLRQVSTQLSANQYPARR